ncbi:MAG TPA: hypothetical protein PKM76_11980, partial [Bacteroidales bacterium]|nr:hypothetical protein [Bacteroidales bacterium]
FSSHPLYRKHDLDSAMSSLWKFYRKKFFVLVFTSFVISIGIHFLTQMFDFYDILKITDPEEMMGKLREMIWPMVAISLVSLLCTTILYYYVIFNPVDSNVTIIVSLYKSLRYYILLLIIMVLFSVFASVAMIFGLMLLVIGVVFSMIYIMTLFLFFTPVLMVEGPDIANAISRTFRLAHRRFWANIGWVAVLLVIMLITSFILNAIITIPFTGGIMKNLTNPEELMSTMDYMRNPVYITLSALASALFYPLIPILGTILYFNGRAREEVISSSDQDLTTLPEN